MKPPVENDLARKTDLGLCDVKPSDCSNQYGSGLVCPYLSSPMLLLEGSTLSPLFIAKSIAILEPVLR